MASSSSSTSSLLLQQQQRAAFEQLSNVGPHTAFAAGCVANDVLYLHGGVSEPRSTKPCKNLHKYALTTREWELINSSGPPLSHHACIPFPDKQVIMFIGGWNGKERSSDVYIYDYKNDSWTHCGTSGFPVGAGLSSHTANLLSNEEILIIGREGSLRMQRRSGNAFILYGSIPKRQFVYRDLPLAVASRSGHTTSTFKNTVIIVGGRSDRLCETHRVPHATSTATCMLSKLASSSPVMSKLPCGRKNHSATVFGNGIVIYGGETFDGRSKEPVSELYIIDKDSLSWKCLGKTDIGRAGHTAVVFNNSIVIHGGVGERNLVSNLTFQLTIP